MKVIKDAYLTQAMYGRIPQQIPNIALGEIPEMEEIPDDWVMYLSGGILRSPRIDAIPYLSPKGFWAFLPEIKKAYIKGMPGRGENRTDWTNYKSNVLNWYDDILRINKKEIINLERRATKKINQLRKLLDRL